MHGYAWNYLERLTNPRTKYNFLQLQAAVLAPDCQGGDHRGGHIAEPDILLLVRHFHARPCHRTGSRKPRQGKDGTSGVVEWTLF